MAWTSSVQRGPWAIGVGWIVGLVLGLGCSERQGDPNYDELIAEACELGCANSIDCGANELYATVDECVVGCTTWSGWDELDQCDARWLEHKRCLAEVDCSDYPLADEIVEADGSLKDEFACRDELLAWYACDPDEPFDLSE